MNKYCNNDYRNNIYKNTKNIPNSYQNEYYPQTLHPRQITTPNFSNSYSKFDSCQNADYFMQNQSKNNSQQRKNKKHNKKRSNRKNLYSQKNSQNRLEEDFGEDLALLKNIVTKILFKIVDKKINECVVDMEKTIDKHFKFDLSNSVKTKYSSLNKTQPQNNQIYRQTGNKKNNKKHPKRENLKNKEKNSVINSEKNSENKENYTDIDDDSVSSLNFSDDEDIIQPYNFKPFDEPQPLKSFGKSFDKSFGKSFDKSFGNPVEHDNTTTENHSHQELPNETSSKLSDKEHPFTPEINFTLEETNLQNDQDNVDLQNLEYVNVLKNFILNNNFNTQK